MHHQELVRLFEKYSVGHVADYEETRGWRKFQALWYKKGDMNMKILHRIDNGYKRRYPISKVRSWWGVAGLAISCRHFRPAVTSFFKHLIFKCKGLKPNIDGTFNLTISVERVLVFSE